jgi:hypothetical protein
MEAAGIERNANRSGPNRYLRFRERRTCHDQAQGVMLPSPEGKNRLHRTRKI